MRKDDRWRRHHPHRPPPWWGGPEGLEGDPSGPAPPWPRAGRVWDGRKPSDHWMPGDHWRHGGGYLFFRFAAVFGLFVVLGCAILALIGAGALAFFPSRLPPELPLGRMLLFLAGAGFLLLLALRRVGTFASHRFTSPLSEVMRAADRLAGGDLGARVDVSGSSELRHLADSFNRMAEALQTADHQRRELLADVAHELRTPLTIIQGNLEGLRDGVYQPLPDHADLVLDEVRKLGRLVDDLRLLTLAEAGQLPLDLQEVDVAQLLADVRDAFAAQAEEAGVDLVVQAGDGLPPLLGDPQRLGQVLGNLTNNALRHTPDGGRATLGAEIFAPEGVTSGIRLWVADTGEGIAADDLPRVFDRFWRGDPARSHEAGAGMGLGLAIARGLVEAHGGHIWVESDGVPGRGTAVSLVLPC
jgi:two-component system sensor histidine kinase BaeS